MTRKSISICAIGKWMCCKNKEKSKMSLSSFNGKKLKFIKKVKPVRIDYKYGSLLGIGGDHSCGYNLCEYDLEGIGPVNVFVADYWGTDDKTISQDFFQFGMEDGVLFLVNHGEQKGHGIYQWRFTQAAGGLSIQKNVAIATGAAISNYLKTKGVPIDLSWIAGDPLRNF